MNFKLMNRIALAALLGFIIMLSACKKEDSVEIVETEEPIELGYKMVVNGTEIETDAFAAYCQGDSLDIIVVSNKQEHLTLPIQNSEPGDYRYTFYVEDGSKELAYAFLTFGEEVTSLGGDIFAITASSSDIESNDGEVVVGSFGGTIAGLDLFGNIVGEYTFSVEFAAEVVQESDCQ